MSLGTFFAPRSIALVGASADPSSISARPLRMLAQHGYPTAQLYPVNPKYSELQGLQVYPSIGSVPKAVDLALVAVPAALVPDVLRQCAQADVRYALVLSSGFAEAGASGQHLQQQIADIVQTSALRVSGPNSEGFFAATTQVCATFSPAVDPEHGFALTPPGPVAVVSQSGGLGFALLGHGREHGIRFNAIVSSGNEVDLTWLDYVDYLLDEPSVRVILGFVEGLRDLGRLARTAHKAAQLHKPLIVAKMGRSAAARRAAAFHTGSDVGDDTEYEAAFERLGIVRVDDLDEMLDVAAYFSIGRIPRGRRMAILTTSGGAGTWLADACAMRGFELPQIDSRIQDEIRSFIPNYGSTANPVDITAQAVFGGGFERALGLLAHTLDVDAVAAVGSMVREERFLDSLGDLQAAIDGAVAPIVFYAYTRPSRSIVEALATLGIPCYASPGRAARALAAAASYQTLFDSHLTVEARS